MRRRVVVLALAATALATLPAVTGSASAAPADTTRGEQRVCAHAPTGVAACDAHVRTRGAKPDATTSFQSGYTPAQLRSAYGLTALSGTTTVAVVDAYAHPSAAADLDVYRQQFGLGTADLTQFNQDGGPIDTVSGNTGWGQEEMLDLEMVSAICPTCPIIYVGANSASFADLAKAMNTAENKGAKVVSNSYGAAEFNGETTYASAYSHTGVAITVSSGDSGYGAQVPAAFNTVTAVGGTTLKLTNGLRSSETVWSGAGSGCSAYISKPSWQKDSSCSRRTIADVAAVADPATGVAVYDSYGSTGGANWYVFGGTSVAAPIIGGIYGLTGASTAGTPTTLAYTNKANLFDVTSGSNGRCVRGKNTAAAYLCTGVVGYDGPTGNGTPNGSLAPF
jgi:subtilase family serine protease